MTDPVLDLVLRVEGGVLHWRGEALDMRDKMHLPVVERLRAINEWMTEVHFKLGLALPTTSYGKEPPSLLRQIVIGGASDTETAHFNAGYAEAIADVLAHGRLLMRDASWSFIGDLLDDIERGAAKGAAKKGGG